MNRIARVGACCAAVLLALGMTRSAAAGAGAVEDEIRELRERIRVLEEKAERDGEKGPASGRGPTQDDAAAGEYAFDVSLVRGAAERLAVEVHGRADAAWGSHQWDLAQGGTRDRNFFDANFALWFGADVNEHVSANAEIEYEHSGGELEVDQMQIVVAPFGGRANTITFGKFYVPFGVEYLSYPAHRNVLVSRPYPMRTIVPGTWADTGVKLAFETAAGGLPARLGGAFYVTNGLGEASASKPDPDNSRDNNDDKAVGAQLRLFSDKGEAGFSVSTGKWDANDDRRYRLAGVHAVLKTPHGELRAEYVLGDYDLAGGPRGKPRGYYAQYFHAFRETLGAAVRYDAVDDRGGLTLVRGPAAGTRAARVSAGVRWAPWKGTVFKAEYMVRTDSAAGVRDRHAVATQAAVHF